MRVIPKKHIWITPGYRESYLDSAFCNYKLFRKHATLHAAGGTDRSLNMLMFIVFHIIRKNETQQLERELTAVPFVF